jgi:hypothetical protein
MVFDPDHLATLQRKFVALREILPEDRRTQDNLSSDQCYQMA